MLQELGLNQRMNEAQGLLQEVFGWKSLRPMQERVISHVLQKQHALVVMPTGGGKSLCYQLPALVFSGLTLVISPLISLMKDQVDQLRGVGVGAVCLNSSLSADRYERNVEAIRSGQAKLLYVAPEALFGHRLNALLSEMEVACIAIDEAHCISEWGHDFRPEYRRLSELRQRYPDALCLALTATASPRVREDIVRSLDLASAGHFIDSFDRPNLFLEVSAKQGDGSEQILELVRRFPEESGIVYGFSRKRVAALADYLSQAGIQARPYHGGLSNETRHLHQEQFLRDEIQVIVATIAFGMGIDKPDVRFVAHIDLPKSLAAYYQEIGRAGRDGLPAHCQLLFRHSDSKRQSHFVEQKEGRERESAEAQLRAVIDWAEATGCRRHGLLGYFGQSPTHTICEMCDQCARATNDNAEDITLPAQKFLSCVYRTGQVYGESHVIQVLRGSRSKKVKQKGHDRLSTYNIGSEYSKPQWQDLAHQFLALGLVKRDQEYGGLSLTQEGLDVCRGVRRVEGTLPKIQQRPTNTEGQDLEAYDQDLFQELRVLRKQLADQEELPPYAIFSDRTLREMCMYYPKSIEELLQVQGVGKVKSERYGTTFIEAIQRYCQENPEATPSTPPPAKPKERSARSVSIGAAQQTGLSPTQLAEKYELKPSTIIGHLLKHLQEGGTLHKESLLADATSTPIQQQEILAAFATHSAERLKPVKEALDPDISYDELHLMRLIYLIEQNAQ